MGAAASERPGYERQVGERLRAVRRQVGLTLQEVAEASENEFKASVLSAYERGERAISVPRLHRLARFYGVAVDELLPKEGPRREAADDEAPAGPGGRKARLRVDLRQLEERSDPPVEMLQRFVEAIQVRRGDYNGRVLTLREADVHQLARLWGIDPGQLWTRLAELEVGQPA